ncbi:MAG: DUF192 domain-containing protein [Candidatus Saccharibacteria bacterium]
MNTKRNIGTPLIVSCVVLGILATFMFVIPTVSRLSTNLRLGDGAFKAQMALKSSDRDKGLLGTSGLNSDQALLLAFPTEDQWGVWPKSTTFSIDIVWLNKDKKVIYIVKNISPGNTSSVVFKPKTPAKYIIEFPAGTVDRESIEINQLATFQINTDDIK